jgi:3-oxoacyl-[acyl-carrier-protein] synthase III
MSPNAHITGWGMAVPQRVLTNAEIALTLDTNDEWIVSHTGIRERRIAGKDDTTASLATEAALKAMLVANVKPSAIDLIIVSTSTPEHLFPATACLVQDRLGATRAGAFDLMAACSGFIFALNMATQFVKNGTCRTVLVIGSETLSRLINWQDRNTCILFGDGAGAFIIQGSDEPGGVLSGVIRSDGSGGDLLSVPAGGSACPTSIDTVHDGLHFIQMNGREVFRFATRVMAQATLEAVSKAKLTMNDIKLIIPHQANLRIIQAAAKGLNVPMEHCFVNLDRYGNTSTASIPIATVEAIQQGLISPGDRIAFVGFGAGLTWGSAIVEWSGPLPGIRRARPYPFHWYARIRSLLLRVLRKLDAWIWSRQSR